MHPEKLTQPEQDFIPAREVFVVDEHEIDKSVSDAVDNGVINIEMTEEKGITADIHKLIGVESGNVINDRELTEREQHEGYNLIPSQAKLVDPEKVHKKEAKQIKKEAVEIIGEKTKWFLRDEVIRNEIETGKVYQIFTFSFNGKEVPLINFTETKISDQQAEDFRKTMERQAWLTGGSIFDKLNGVCILPEDCFPERRYHKNDNLRSAGQARGSTGTIRLSEKILDPDFEVEYDEYAEVVDKTPLQMVFTHELGHIVDLSEAKHHDYDLQHLNYGKAVGWKSKVYTLDDGSLHQISGREQIPSKSYVSKNGNIELTKTDELVDESDLDQLKPVTAYGDTNEREDFAEASVVRTWAPNSDMLDNVRRNAIDNIYHVNSGGEHGPFRVSINEVDLSSAAQHKIGTYISPQSLKARVMYDISPSVGQGPQKT